MCAGEILAPGPTIVGQHGPVGRNKAATMEGKVLSAIISAAFNIPEHPGLVFALHRWMKISFPNRSTSL